MTLIRTFFSILILLIIVSVMAMFLIVYLIDPNDLKPMITAEVKKKTGYEMVIPGDLSWTIYPRLAIKIDSLSLAENKEANAFLRLKGIKLAVEMTDLIHRKESLPGTLYIDSLNFKNVHAEKVWAHLSWQKDGFIFDPIKADLYGGNLAGKIEGSELSNVPHLRFDLQLNRIQLKPLLEDINGLNSKIKINGQAIVKFAGESIGKTKQQLLNELNGKLEFNVFAGAIEGIDLNYFVQTADALLNKQKLEELPNSNQTDFDQFKGSVIIKNGTARTKDLLLVSKSFITKGEGSLNLASEHIDAALTIVPTQTDKIPWKIPLLISDNIKNPSIRLNMGEIQKLIMRQEIDKIKMKAQDQIKKHVPGKTGEFLQHLLGS